MMHLHSERCQELLETISDYTDGSLQSELCRLLETHLAGCEDCRVVVDTLRKTVELYRAERTRGIPEDVKRRLFKRLQLEDLFPSG